MSLAPDHAEIRDYRRRRLLEAASHEGRRVRIGGVVLALSSPRIDRTLWSPNQVVGLSADVPDGPALIFPWDMSQPAPAASLAHLIQVEAGDTVLIDQVRSQLMVTRFGEFEHPHETEDLLARLVVRRANGETVPVEGELRYSRSTSALRTAFGDRTDEKVLNELVQRLEVALGVDDVLGLIQTRFATRAHELPFSGPRLADHLEAFAALERAQGGITEAFATFGYHMARAETADGPLPIAIQSRSRGRKAGAEPAVTTRAHQAVWQAHAIAVARLVLMDAASPRPGLGLARAVLARWNDVGDGDRPVPKSEDTIARFLRKAERDGDFASEIPRAPRL